MYAQMNFMVGGEAGQGVQSLGFLMAKAFARGGYYVFADQDYESRIRGGHNFFRVRVRTTEIGAIAEPVDMLIALNKETIDLHLNEVSTEGIVIYDGEKTKGTGDDSRLLNMPLKRLAEEKASGQPQVENTVALGGALGLVGYDLDIISRLLREHFGTGDTAENNVAAVKAGYEHARTEFKGKWDRQLTPCSDSTKMLLTGNDAMCLGALAANCQFMAAYPMTPTTSIMEYMSSRSKDLNLAMVQAEDEIAAVNMAIGAAFAGVRAMTATSGSGFCLMVEGIGLAAMTETPVVLIDGQRPGPTVGLPTRTEQGDLLFALHAHHGDFPRVVLAPATIEDAFWITVNAFNLADRYQTPVIILTDHHLASSYATVPPFDLSRTSIDRGLLFTNGDKEPSGYKRYEITSTGISPRAFPGQGKALVVADSDEHDEAGHLTEDAHIRTAQVQKRLRKMLGLRQEVIAPWRHGPKGADTTLIGWGSTYWAIRETVDILHKEGLSVNSLHLNQLWPFPSEEMGDAISRARFSYVIENNASGQLARLVKAETGREVSGRILKYDGRPFTPGYLVEAVKKEGGLLM